MDQDNNLFWVIMTPGDGLLIYRGQMIIVGNEMISSMVNEETMKTLLSNCESDSFFNRT